MHCAREHSVFLWVSCVACGWQIQALSTHSWIFVKMNIFLCKHCFRSLKLRFLTPSEAPASAYQCGQTTDQFTFFVSAAILFQLTVHAQKALLRCLIIIDVDF